MYNRYILECLLGTLHFEQLHKEAQLSGQRLIQAIEDAWREIPKPPGRPVVLQGIKSTNTPEASPNQFWGELKEEVKLLEEGHLKES
ncbi:hypothetical protein DPEC_G00032740 [Dallia pectoralis]|uniref:Uncharacterized protein n=1 Tax=Dallia pectoralis TaxID=75939 RepID=A0ACC2HD85_DALPE|nr:hypothetical protein DPEC_G00032740 [Dallia pectoralis]